MAKFILVLIMYFSIGFSYVPLDVSKNEYCNNHFIDSFELKGVIGIIENSIETLNTNKFFYKTKYILPSKLKRITWWLNGNERITSFWSNFEKKKDPSVWGPFNFEVYATEFSDYIKETYDEYSLEDTYKKFDQMKIDFNFLVSQYTFLLIEDDKEYMSRSKKNKTLHEYDLWKIRKLVEETNPVFDRLHEIQDKIIYDCAYKCHNVYAVWDQGFSFFMKGELMNSLEIMKSLIDQYGENLPKIYEMQGEISQELGLYKEAVKSLSEAIKLDPENKDAYYSRASCYFELGDYEKSIEDFIKSGFSSKKIDSEDFDSLDFATGLLKGTSLAALGSLEDFLPSIYSSVSGLTNGLWSFVNNPIDCSIEMIQACKTIASLVSDNSAYENLRLLIPEIGQLAENWDSSSPFKKGELLGNIIGKHGTDIFITGASIKAFKAYTNLRKANNLMTLEGMTKAAKKKKILEFSETWNKKSNAAIEKIQNDLSGRELYKQLRDITDENHLRKALHKHGIPTFEKPKGIPKDWKVKITEKSGGIKYYDPKNPHLSVRVMPGKPTSPNPAQHKPYIVHRIGEYALDKIGNKVTPDCSLSHIPLEEFIFRD